MRFSAYTTVDQFKAPYFHNTFDLYTIEKNLIHFIPQEA